LIVKFALVTKIRGHTLGGAPREQKMLKGNLPKGITNLDLTAEVALAGMYVPHPLDSGPAGVPRS